MNELHWLAGIIEGESSFVLAPWKDRRYPRITMNTTDEDVANHAARILGVKVYGPYYGHSKLSKKPNFRFNLNGSRAVGWMQTLYPLLGKRRQARIRECITAWTAGKIPR